MLYLERGGVSSFICHRWRKDEEGEHLTLTLTTTFDKECRANSPNHMASGQAQLRPHPLSQHYSRAQVRYRVLSLECCSCGLGSAFLPPVKDKDRGLISLTTPPGVREKGWG